MSAALPYETATGLLESVDTTDWVKPLDSSTRLVIAVTLPDGRTVECEPTAVRLVHGPDWTGTVVMDARAVGAL